MTTTITIEVPQSADYEVLVVDHDRLSDGTIRDTERLPVKPGLKLVCHIWDGRSVTISERKIPATQAAP